MKNIIIIFILSILLIGCNSDKENEKINVSYIDMYGLKINEMVTIYMTMNPSDEDITICNYSSCDINMSDIEDEHEVTCQYADYDNTNGNLTMEICTIKNSNNVYSYSFYDGVKEQ